MCKGYPIKNNGVVVDLKRHENMLCVCVCGGGGDTKRTIILRRELLTVTSVLCSVNKGTSYKRVALVLPITSFLCDAFVVKSKFLFSRILVQSRVRVHPSLHRQEPGKRGGHGSAECFQRRSVYHGPGVPPLPLQ